MDRIIDPEVRRRQWARRVVTVALSLGVITFLFAATVQWLRPSIRRSDVQWARVERGAVDATLQANGTTMPAVEQVVSSPVEARVLRIVRHAGDAVRAGGIEITVEADDTVASIDVLQFEQVVLNVLKNAADSIERDGRIAVTLRDSVLAIADTGAGISVDAARDLFTPFFTTKREGRGLGLTIVQEILANHGFDFSLRNGEARGAEFRIVMPPAGERERPPAGDGDTVTRST